ncbi:MAG: FAD-dependent oxidoreductase [Candidatus Helarchaeota archaeon]
MSKNLETEKTISIFGGGIAGLNMAIQLADLGFKIYLIEKKPFFGGHAGHLYKAFPTDDCFFCLLSTKYKDGIRKCFYRSGINFHPNIVLLNNTELESCSGKKGNFKIKLIKHATYVNQDCINCGKCLVVCPKINDLNEVFKGNPDLPIISSHYPQCISNYFIINQDKCKFGCNLCEKSCPVNAINLNEKDIHINISCADIILATGFDEYIPKLMNDYKYGIYKDVITQYQLVLMIDPNGPTQGKLIRPSNQKEVKSIVIVQCVGSRDEKYNRYCSVLCCEYAIKNAKILKENYDPPPEVYIVYIDIRTMGFLEKYYTQARENDVKFIKGRLIDIKQSENKENDNKLTLKIYDALLNAVLIIQADLLVLSTAIIMSEDSIELSRKLNLELTSEGFINVKEDQITTNIEGIYACGSVISPMDIVDTITSSKSIALKIFKEINNFRRDNIS